MFTIPESCRQIMGWQVTQYKTNPNAPWEISEAEAALYWDVIEQVKPEVILDLGCGLGRVSAYIAKRLEVESGYRSELGPIPVSPTIPWPPRQSLQDMPYAGTVVERLEPLFLLADSGGEDVAFTKSIGGWHGHEKRWHNNLLATREFCRANGMGDPELYHTPRSRAIPHRPKPRPISRSGYPQSVLVIDLHDDKLPQIADKPKIAISMLAVGFHFAIEPYQAALQEYDAVILGVRKGQYELPLLKRLFKGFSVELRSSAKLPKYDVMIAQKR